MEENISTQIWIIATLFGGVGAAALQLLVGLGKHVSNHKKSKRLLRREIKFNIKQVEQNLQELQKLKEDHIKLDRQNTYWHFFVLKCSAVIFRALINVGTIYDHLNDEQMIKLDNFISENTVFLNEEVAKIRDGTYSKQESANKVDYFITRYGNFKTDLESVLREI